MWFILARSGDKKHQKGFLWLNLNENYLTQWEKFCLRRFLNEKGCSMLSNSKIFQEVRETIMKSEQIKAVASSISTEHTNDISVTVEQEGPACTVKVEVFKHDSNCCYKTNYRQTLFHVDYTLALHCCFWPDEALGT